MAVNFKAYLGQAWPFTLGASSNGIAESCYDLRDTCVDANGNPTCGDYAVFPDCRDRGGSCTPYSFMPNVDNQACSDWMDNNGYSSQPFFQFSSEYSFQAFAAKKDDGSFYDDVWVVHGCDGAGVQPDCRGDVFYLEHFGSKYPVDAEVCPLSTYGDPSDKTQCPTFYHQGKGVNFPDYTCGWWRGYEQPTGIEWASVNGGVGAFGPAGSNGDYSESMRAILANCPTCAYGTALEHPYKETQAAAYFVGAAWPWICTPGDDKQAPYTGEQKSCYCDNEPSNGRQPDWSPIKPQYPQRTQIVYCGLYQQFAGDHHEITEIKLVCDFITLDPSSNEARADHRGVEMFPTDF